MILAIDTGNTHTVVGCVNEKNEVVHRLRIPTDRDDTEYGYAARIQQLFDIFQIDVKAIDASVISSVVPQVTVVLKKAVKILTGLDSLVLGEGIKTNLEIRLEGGIAPDLEATAVAAKEDYPLPCIIVDMGTATTLTVVNEEGAYIGGAILPGVGTALNAMIDATSLLPGISIEPPSRAIAVETVDAMKSGVVYGAAGSIDGIVDHFSQEMGREPASIVMTGGIGHLIAPVCRHEVTVDDDMLLKGLIKIYHMNK